MKQPKISDLKMNQRGTLAIRKKAKATKKIKITINFDADILGEVKKLAKDTGSPYQTLLNKIVRDSLKEKMVREDRLSSLEKEVRALKKMVKLVGS